MNIENAVIGFLGGSFIGMVLAIRILIKYPLFGNTFDRFSTLFCIALIGLWWTGLFWLIFK